MGDITFPTTLRTTRATTIKDAIDAGAGAGTAEVYEFGASGEPPAGCGAITDQTLLGTVTCTDPCGTVLNGVMTFSPFTQDTGADATGTAGFLRFADSTGTVVTDLKCGEAGSNKPVILNTTDIIIGGPISVTSATVTEGGA